MRIEVTQQAMEALNASIAKWREASENRESDVWETLGTSDGCPLCQLYYSRSSKCVDCPLRKFTGHGVCSYPEFINWSDVEFIEPYITDSLLQATKDVLNVLERCKENCVVIKGESDV